MLYHFSLIDTSLFMACSLRSDRLQPDRSSQDMAFIHTFLSS